MAPTAREDSELPLRLSVLPLSILSLACATVEPTQASSPPAVHEPLPVEQPAEAPPADETPAPPSGPEVAAFFQFPTEGYKAGSTHGRRYLHPPNHLGDDSTHEHLTPVVAVGNGVVRHVKLGGVGGYGSVIAVEHRLPDGEVVVSIYGHLCSHEDYPSPVAVGDIVTKGALLGYIGDDDENGHGPEHIHFGIRRGKYDGALCGYTGPRHCTTEHFYDPTEFITARLSPNEE